MKRLLFTLLAVVMILPAMAEGPKRLINIDPESIQPVQKDALTGVNIDPIAKDRSQRPCARIKLHINRMSREDIDQLIVYPIGGNIDLTKKVTSYEGNGLILEMTAKPQTRFFIHHDKYGDSNEVILNLEGNKEYYLEGHLDLLLSIAVATNVVGAEVYLDKAYKGVTDENGLLTIEEVTSGKHLVMLKHGSTIDEQEVEVSSSKISFRLTVNNTSAVATGAVLSAPEVKTYKVGDYYNDGKKEGVVFWVDETGRFGKIVSLKESSSPIAWSSDDFEQRRLIGADDKDDGSKNMAIVKQIPGWESKYPAFKWCADLGDGWYLPAVEELKLFTLYDWGRESINKTLREQGCKVIATSSSSDGYYWSSTENTDKYKDFFCAWRIQVYEMGNHIGTGSKLYHNYVRAVAVFGNPIKRIESTRTSSLGNIDKTYKVGDYYNENGKEGVVFQVWDGGKHGKIVSMTESPSLMKWSSDKKEQMNNIGTNDKHNGANNMEKVKSRKGWESKYPAFKWCADLGEGWYLPAIEELKMFTTNIDVYTIVNQTLKKKGLKLANRGSNHWYWSSTDFGGILSKYGAWYISMCDIIQIGNSPKDNGFYVRAVAAF